MKTFSPAGRAKFKNNAHIMLSLSKKDFLSDALKSSVGWRLQTFMFVLLVRWHRYIFKMM